MKIIHCSDLHICKPGCISAVRGKRFFGWLNWLLNRSRTHKYDVLNEFLKKMKTENPDIICITGDLCQLGTYEELLAAQHYLAQLEAVTGKILYVPGNHDKYIADKKSEAILHEIISKYGNFPAQPVCNVENINFFLTDQTFHNKLFHFNGNISDPTLTKFKEILPPLKQSPIVILGHFPLLNEQSKELKENRKLLQAAELFKILREKKNLLYLCGHIHKPYDLNFSDSITQLCAGSITSENFYYKINIIDNSFSYTLERLS